MHTVLGSILLSLDTLMLLILLLSLSLYPLVAWCYIIDVLEFVYTLARSLGLYPGCFSYKRPGYTYKVTRPPPQNKPTPSEHYSVSEDSGTLEQLSKALEQQLVKMWLGGD